MILKRLSICGFRGIKEPIDLSLSDGFVVVTGRNGSGKSTLCDAIEFGLTGHFGSSEHKEKGESIVDYTWWRGADPPATRYVRIVLQTPNGGQISIERTPTGLIVDGVAKLEDALCDIPVAPTDPIGRLCRTSIIRDEEITKLSVDLIETERFNFVRLALGTTDFGDVEKRAVAVHHLLEVQHQKAEDAYSTLRIRVTDLTARLSTARAEATGLANVAPALETIRQLTNRPLGSSQELLEAATRELPTQRVRIDQLIRLAETFQQTEATRRTIQTDAHLERIASFKRAEGVLRNQLDDIQSEMALVEAKIDQQQREQPRLAALASLRQSGEQLGLQDGQTCPLCGSAISTSDFAAHLLVLDHTLRGGSEEMLQTAQRRAALQQSLSSLRQRLSAAEEQSTVAQAMEAEVDQRMASLTLQASAFGIPLDGQPLNGEMLSRKIEELRLIAGELERAVAVLEASVSFERVTRMDAELKALRGTSEAAEKTMESIGKAVQRAKNGVDTVRRVRGEMIEERLAELSPLMSELYSRLRPHVDWEEIKYHLRGDVRRFLSFEVGDGLNPSFVFSSGQRRAAGMAFLLAVYLARPWCRLRTLILDDPVQHIDDFRALNLTEVLSAIRRSDRQIICTTEDSSLADLMARRLRSGNMNDGLLVQMSYDSSRGVHVIASRRIGPFPNNVLMPA